MASIIDEIKNGSQVGKYNGALYSCSSGDNKPKRLGPFSLPFIR